MKKRIVCLLLSALLSITIFSGCGDNSTPAASSSVPSETSASASAHAPSEADSSSAASSASIPEEVGSTESAADTEIQVEEIPIALPLTTDHVEYSLYTSVSPMIGDTTELTPENNMVILELEQRTGIHLNIQTVSAMSYTEQFMLMIAGGDWTDLLSNVRTTYSGGLASAISEDIIIDLAHYNEYMPNYMNLVTSDTNLYRDVTLGHGEMGAFYGFFNENKPADAGLMVRSDWLAALNMSAPETIDDYDAVARTFYNTYGTTIHLPTNSLFANQAFLSAYEVAGFYIDAGFYTSLQCYTVENGQVICGFTTDGFKEYLQLLAGWYADGLITSDYMSATSTSNYLGDNSEAVASLLNDGIGIWGDSVANQVKYDNTMSVDPNFYAQPTELPTMNAEDEVVCGLYITKIDEAYYSITTSCENPELMIQWIDYAYTSVGSLLYNWGLEETTYTVNDDGSKQFTELVMNNPDGLSTEQAKYAYLGIGSSLRDIDVWYAGYSDAQMACFDVWNKDFTGEKALSTQLSMTTEESELFSRISGDLITYLSESVAKFIVGEKNFDEDYDAFLSDLNSLGLETLDKIEQDVDDRWSGIA